MGSDRSRRVAPRRLASTIVSRPMMPPPITTTVAPRGMANISRPDRQQAAGSVSAAVTGSRARGSGCTQCAGSATRSAKPPTRVAPAHWLMRPAAHSAHAPQPKDGSQATARPTRRGLTPRPTDVMTPVYSWPSTSGGFHGKRPCVAWMSVPQMPAACTATTTCLGPAIGSGASSTLNRAPPRQVATFMGSAPLELRRALLDERLDALGGVLGLEAGVLRERLVLEGGAQVALGVAVEAALGQPDRDGRPGGDRAGQRLRGGQELLGRQHLAHDAQAQGLGRVDHRAGEDELGRL